MEHPEYLNLVLDFLASEVHVALPNSYAERRILMRALVNQREPMPVPPAVLAAQDALLAAELAERGIVDAAALLTLAEDFPLLPYADRLCIWRGDITRLRADAIVNAANSQMEGCWLPLHNCIDNAIHCGAGMQLRQACHDMMREPAGERVISNSHVASAAYPEPPRREPTGSARITPGFNLPARHVIHTVGPIVDGPLTARHKDLLASCYRSCLELAARAACTSLAFCCISTGEFRFPKAEAAAIALDTVIAALRELPNVPQRIIFNTFSEADYDLYRDVCAARL